MNKTTDILVIGGGLAGLTAALAAAEVGCKTSVLCEGMGNLSISGGCIDFLGYDSSGQRLENPWDGLASLSPEHPYSLLGKDWLKSAFSKFVSSVSESGLKYHTGLDASRDPVNTRVPTIVGTLKPTYLLPEEIDPELLNAANKVLVISVKGFRDCKPRLVIEQLRRYPEWADKEYSSLVLSAPFNEKGRSLNALDIARAADRIHGREWLLRELHGKGNDYDIAFLPPILGAKAVSSIREEARNSLGCPIVEMQSIPPGVTGLRLRDALVNKLYKLGVRFFENAQVIGASVKDGRCQGITVDASGREVIHEAESYVIATGGIISGGIVLGEGAAKEAVFGLELSVPPNVDDWTEPAIFGQHFVSSLGVPVDAEMRPLAEVQGKKLENVFFAGRTIGGYDYASEKSGHGVAVATGWKAGEMAASNAGCSASTVSKGDAQ